MRTIGDTIGHLRWKREAVSTADDALLRPRRRFESSLRSQDAATVALVAVLALVAFDFRPLWLVELQRVEIYKLGSGLALAALVGYQWLLSFYRFVGRRRRARRQFVAHQRTAILAPLLFYAHSVSFGYGYLLLLSGTYLGNVAVGLLNPQRLKLPRRVYLVTWMLLHVALSVLVLVLAAYHVWVALSYE